MKLTRQRIITALSALYLLLLTALAAYAQHTSHAYSLPISGLLGALCIALPPLAGTCLSAVQSLQLHKHSSSTKRIITSSNNTNNTATTAPSSARTTPLTQIILTAFLLLSTVLATLASTHLSSSPSSSSALPCTLRTQWTALFHSKSASQIKQIQDALSCCGFASSRDMAWPFPSQSEGRGGEACILRYPERDQRGGCGQGWWRVERRVAGLFLGVVVGVGGWMILTTLLTTPSSQSRKNSWFAASTRHYSTDDEGRASSSSPTRARKPAPAIEYRDVIDGRDPDDDESVREEVERLNKDSNLASHVEGERTRSKGLWREREQERWRREEGEGV